MNFRKYRQLLWIAPVLFFLGLGLGYYWGNLGGTVILRQPVDAQAVPQQAEAEAPAEAVESIVATHYTGNSFAPDMWGSLNLGQTPGELQAIRSNGFNAIILPVPWAGFQSDIDPIAWEESYFTKLEGVIEAANAEGLDVLLRIAYLHELSVPSHTDGGRRAVEIFYDPATQNAWREYLLRLKGVMWKHGNVRFAYLTWEDFFFYWIMGVPIEWRLKLGHDMGYQDFLKDTPLEKINHLYGETFASHGDIPIPLYDTPSAALYYAFHDHLWMRVLGMSREVLPEMNFEIRTDCDPTGGGPLFCHDQTFDLGGEGITVVYYSPGWGAPNKGDLATGAEAARLFEAMLAKVREKTDNPIFVDQFNFVDNTMEFRRNTSIDSAELPDFLARSAQIIKTRTMGYGLWTMQDKPRSVLTNGSFELGGRDWTIEGGRIEAGPDGGQSLVLDTGGEAGHDLAMTGGMRGVSDEEAHKHNMTLRLFAANPGAETARFLVRVYDENGKQLYGSIGSLLPGEEKTIDFHGIPGIIFGKLSITCQEGSARFDQALFYAFEQKNGIYDLNGAPRPFRDSLLRLNATLTGEGAPTAPEPEHAPRL